MGTTTGTKSLLELTTNQLLEKIGKGSHIPGSGSTAALQGLMAAKLVLTVIDLTLKKPRYSKTFTALNSIKQDLSDSCNRLVELFDLDSQQFDLVISLRNDRDHETDLGRKRAILLELEKQTIASTLIPIEIGQVCKKIADHAFFLFDHGFKSARGDSSVAFNAASAGLAGTIAIIDLNLKSLSGHSWVNENQKKLDDLKHWEQLAIKNIDSRRIESEKEAKEKHKFFSEIRQVAADYKLRRTVSTNDIEQLVTKLYQIADNYQSFYSVFKQTSLGARILDSEKVLKLLGYLVGKENLSNLNALIDGNYEVAGLIDNRKGFIKISSGQKSIYQNFTLAHELGHAVLHDFDELHRDRPLDGSLEKQSRPPIEWQADKFAANILMPKDLVIGVFENRYGPGKFEINQNTAQLLANTDPNKLRAICQNKRGLSMQLASASRYGATSGIKSMSELFEVSVGAMAIRLEELSLVSY